MSVESSSQSRNGKEELLDLSIYVGFREAFSACESLDQVPPMARPRTPAELPPFSARSDGRRLCTSG